MNGTPFKLGRFAKSNGERFAAIVMGVDAIDLAPAQKAYQAAGRRGSLAATDSIQGLLDDWDANFTVHIAFRLIRNGPVTNLSHIFSE
jgi:hypothetical protein